MQDNRLDLEVRQRLTAIRSIEHHDSVSSTNDRIKERIRQRISPGFPCLIIASKQTSGRGRGGKSWWSGEGALMMSFGFELAAFSLTRDDLSSVSVLTGLSAAQAIQRHLGPSFQLGREIDIHWPNDVHVFSKKICGILIESPTPQTALLGIGINVNNRLSEIPPEFREELERRRISSMIEILGRPTDIPAMIVDFLTCFHYNVLRFKYDMPL